MTLQRKATLISSMVAAILIIIKVVIGFLSGSVGVMASAIDSVLDLIASAFNYFAVTKAEQPADEKFNYGKGKVEALASVIEGSIITVSGLVILYQAIKKYFTAETTTYLNATIMVMGASIVLTLFLVLFLNHVAKKTNNLVIKADALHYKTDIYTNGAILISLILVSWTHLEIIDSIIGGGIALYIIYSAYDLIKEGVLVLLDVALDDKEVEKIKQILKKEPEVTSFHFLKTRSSGNINFVDAHLVFYPEISLLQAHQAADSVEEKIKSIDLNKEWAITLHLDPTDDSKFH